MGLALVAVAASGAATLLPAGEANAQQEPTIELLPPSGPCDAPIEVRGRAFEPQQGLSGELLFYLLEPGMQLVFGEAGATAVPVARMLLLTVGLGMVNSVPSTVLRVMSVTTITTFSFLRNMLLV